MYHVYKMRACIRVCVREIMSTCACAQVYVRPRALMRVFVGAHARVLYVYVQVYVREIVRLRPRACVSASARVCVRVLMCAALLHVCACTHVCLCARVGACVCECVMREIVRANMSVCMCVGVTQRDGMNRVL